MDPPVPPQNLTKLLAPHRGKIRICPKSKKVSTYCVVSSIYFWGINTTLKIYYLPSGQLIVHL